LSVYKSETLFGSVQKIEDTAAKNEALFYFIEHMMKGRRASPHVINQEEFERTLVVEMTIETASSKVRDVGVADELEDHKLDIWAGIIPMKQVAGYPISDEGKPRNMEIPQHILDYYEANK